MKTGEAENWLKQGLMIEYDEGEATAMAALVLESLSGLKHAERSFHKNDELGASQMQQLQQIMQRLLQHEPVQYVLGKAWFYDLALNVTPNVLIPRPETEELVYWILQDIKRSGPNVFERHPGEADLTTQLKILDIGTGSGCIALALKKEMPKAEVWGCDVSDAALNVARRNGSELDIRVDFQGVDILDEAQQRSLPTVDIIVSNPPYIPVNEKQLIPKNVVLHEPHLALFVPDEDALKFYRSIAHFGHKRLYNKGRIYLEIHEALGQEVISLLESEGYDTILKKDMQGKDRMVKAWKK